MALTYMNRRRADTAAHSEPAQSTSAGPSLDALRRGAMPTQGQLGRQVNLPGAIRTKMESSFGMDFSGVKLYESQTVADAGAQAVTMGNKIGFAPGQLDLASSGGQTLLGHELSHVASQARGEVSGRGFLADRALESRADREGAMAAAGETVYSGPVSPVSDTSTALSAAGPMQAKKPRDSEETPAATETPAVTEAPVETPAEIPAETAAEAPQPTLTGHNNAVQIMRQMYEQRMAEAQTDAEKDDVLKEMGEYLGNYVEAVSAQCDAGNMGDYDIDKDTELLDLAVEMAGTASNRAMKALGPDAPTSALQTAAFRGGGGATEKAQRAMNRLMTRQMGGKDAITGMNFPEMPTTAEDGTVLSRTERKDRLTKDNMAQIAGEMKGLIQNSPAIDTLKQFRDRAFEGIDMPAAKQSSAVMNNFVTRTIANTMTFSGADDAMMKGMALQRAVAQDSQTSELSEAVDNPESRELLDLLNPETHPDQPAAPQEEVPSTTTTEDMSETEMEQVEERVGGNNGGGGGEVRLPAGEETQTSGFQSVDEARANLRPVTREPRPEIPSSGAQVAIAEARARLRPINGTPRPEEPVPEPQAVEEEIPPTQEDPVVENPPVVENQPLQPEDSGQEEQISSSLMPEAQPEVTVRSSEGEGNTLTLQELPRSGAIQAAIGEDVGKYPSYGKMLGAIDTLCTIITMQQDIPASASGEMMAKLVDAYDTTIAAMQAYDNEMGKFAWTRAGRAKRAARRAYVQDLIQTAQADRARIMADVERGRAAGRTPREEVSQARTEELQDQDFTGVIKGGAINQVYRYRQGYFKPSNGGQMSGNEQSYARDIGLKYQDNEGNAIDPHMNEREVASSRLDKLLGGGVIGGAKKAQIAGNSQLKDHTFTGGDKERTFNAGAGQSGVLMDEAQGMAYNDYNWDFLGVDMEDTESVDKLLDHTNTAQLKSFMDPSKLKKQHVQGVDHEQSAQQRKKVLKAEGTGITLNASDPKLQRDMNALFLLDTLALQTDRHSGNFMIQADEEGNYKGLTGIDNDISFGENNEAFGQRMTNYSGLPEEMLIDRELANRIRAVTENELKLVFSDLLTEGEIAALWERFQMLSQYCDEMEERGLLVSEWNEETAVKQMMIQSGYGDRKKKDYYSRHLQALRFGGAMKQV